MLTSSADGKTLTLCVDEEHPGVNTEFRGERLFSYGGKLTGYNRRRLKFLQEYGAHYERTRAFCKRIKELDLLESMQAQATTSGGRKLSLKGFLSVSRDKLRKLPDDKLAELARADALELLYLQLHSMRNFNEVKDRLVGSLKEEAPAEAAAG